MRETYRRPNRLKVKKAPRDVYHEKNRTYGRRWRLLRELKLADQPICEDCEFEGRVTVATEVHHKRRTSKGGDHAAENLMSLCHECHARRTAAGQ